MQVGYTALAAPTGKTVGHLSVSALAMALLLASAPARAADAQAAVSQPTVQDVQPEQSQPAPVAPTPVVPTPVAPPSLPVDTTAPVTAQAPTAQTDPNQTPAAQTSSASAPEADNDNTDVVVTGRRREPGIDPFEAVNVETYKVVQVADKAIVAPVAMGYKNVVPTPIRRGVRNFFNNLGEPIVFLNYLLQLKPGKAAETAARFAVNTTVGVAGLVDVAKNKPFHLPIRRNGFANTLGYYGVPPGPFLYIPLVGPTTVRDLIGLTLDKAVLPLTVGPPFGEPYYAIPASTITSIDYRVEYDAQLRAQRDSADPYAASRANYLRTRQAEIDALHGRVAAPNVDPKAAPGRTLAPMNANPTILPAPEITPPAPETVPPAPTDSPTP